MATASQAFARRLGKLYGARPRGHPQRRYSPSRPSNVGDAGLQFIHGGAQQQFAQTSLSGGEAQQASPGAPGYFPKGDFALAELVRGTVKSETAKGEREPTNVKEEPEPTRENLGSSSTVSCHHRQAFSSISICAACCSFPPRKRKCFGSVSLLLISIALATRVVFHFHLFVAVSFAALARLNKRCFAQTGSCAACRADPAPQFLVGEQKL